MLEDIIKAHLLACIMLYAANYPSGGCSSLYGEHQTCGAEARFSIPLKSHRCVNIRAVCWARRRAWAALYVVLIMQCLLRAASSALGSNRQPGAVITG